jgi:uroporphyrin-III C-methyltransferase
MAPALLTAVDSTSHIHLVVGSNPLAGARCSRAIEVGAKPILIAPEDSTLHYGLSKRIEAGEVKWIQRHFDEKDLTTLGRPEVDGVVDAVYVTAGGKQTSGKPIEAHRQPSTKSPQLHKSRVFAEDCGYP